MNTPDQRIKRRLVSMPPVPPAPQLWPRLQQARQRRVDRFKNTVGAAAVLLLCVALVPLLGDSGRPPAPAPLANSSGAPTAPQATLDQDTLEQIRALDRALQTAYDEGASDDEVEPLWKARQALLPRHASASRPITNGSSKG